MKLGYQLNLAQTQKLIMTPELRQAISVLQLSTLELNTFIQEQLLENPLLEVVDDVSQVNSEQPENVEKVDVEWEEYFQDGGDLGYRGEAKEHLPFEQYIYQKTPSMQEYLEEQLRYQKLTEEDFALAQFIIGNLDQSGYFTLSIKDTADDLEIKHQKLEEALQLIQSLEPDGIGARDLSECLLIQLRKKNMITPLLEKLISKHLPDIGQGKIVKVGNSLGLSVEEIQAQVDILKTLNPKPGAAFGSNLETRFITPDLMIEKIDNEYIVLVNDSFTPRLIVSELYKEIINNKNADELTRNFIEGKLHGAVWLIKSIEQRRITLYKIANALIEKQKEFLDKGNGYLAPLTLKDIAERVEVHESTVSRAIANKYVQTPRGLFPLKFFFCNGLSNHSGRKVSSQVIKTLVAELISQEDPKEPLSDQMLCNLLQEKGLKIARRTVGKYREELGILSASLRKRY
ncbi:MAG: RNA polymerase factor sigma-54 [Bacillota bacterium]